MCEEILIHENYEPLNQYKEENLNVLFTLPKKVFCQSTFNLYKLMITFLEATYIKIEYKTRDGLILFSCIFNLSDNISRIVSEITDYLDDLKCL